MARRIHFNEVYNDVFIRRLLNMVLEKGYYYKGAKQALDLNSIGDYYREFIK